MAKDKEDEVVEYEVEGEEPEKKDMGVVEAPSDAEGEAGADSDDTEEGDDTPAEEEEHPDDTDDEREAIRARRREEKRRKREEAKERDEARRREFQALKREREELAQRLAVLERRSVSSEFAQLDEAIKQTTNAREYLREQIKLAGQANDGVTLADATDKLYQANRHLEHLTNLKTQAVQHTRNQETRSPIDPEVNRRGSEWMSKHTWYDPSGSQPDSKVALTIDQGMAEEGWDPRTQEYWDELDSRLQKYLPHRYETQRQQPAAQRRTSSPVTGSSRDSTPSSGRPVFKLSAERVAALKEMGAWDDEDRRMKMIKQYQAYDRAQQK